MIELQEYRKSVNSRLHELELARHQVKVERQALVQLNLQFANIHQAVKLAQDVAEAVQREAHSQIADIVSRSLEAVFDTPYEFKINFEQRRGRTEASLTFERDGLSVDPMTASGGGIVAMASFALRLSCLLLAKPPLRRLLVLDEPFTHLSADYIGRARELLLTLSKELDVQIIMVTHLEALQVGKVVEL